MRELGARRLPLLDRLAAHPARTARGRGQRGGPRLLRPARRRAARSRASSPSRRSTTGTCRRRSRTRAAGRRATTAEAFADYAERRRRAARRPRHALDARSTSPGWSPGSATASGVHAPGRRERRRRARGRPPPPARARARRSQAIRARGAAAAGRHRAQPRARSHPATDPSDDAAAARVDGYLTAGTSTRSSAASIRPTCWSGYAAVAPPVEDGDLAAIAAPIDFLGVNYYSPAVVRPAGCGGRARAGPRRGGASTPTCSGRSTRRAERDAGPRPPRLRARRSYVTENGAAFADVRGHDGGVSGSGAQRVPRGPPARRRRAIAAGRAVRGYFVWSLLDNFEWALRLLEAFGIVYVDYPTLERIRKEASIGTATSSPAGTSAAGVPLTTADPHDERLRALRRRGARVRHHAAGHAAALAELPRPGRALRPLHEHGRRLHVLARRAAAPPHALPLQRRAATTRSAATSTCSDGGTVWNPGWKPTKTPLDRYECRHGLGYTRIIGAKDGVEVELLFFVPPGENAEIWKIDGPQHRRRAEGADALLLRRVLPLRGAERHDELPAHVLDRRGRGRGLRRSTTRPSTASAATTTRSSAARATIDGFDTVARRLRRRAQRPARGRGAVRRRGARTASRTAGTRSASHQLDLRLAPGAEETFAFVLGYVEQGDAPKFERPAS